jgi:D-alanyl-lipoteichoic acid acyltransferase DltB (MBOAT superfamily)
MLFVILGWVVFRADSIQEAFTYIGTMFGSTGSLQAN